MFLTTGQTEAHAGDSLTAPTLERDSGGAPRTAVLFPGMGRFDFATAGRFPCPCCPLRRKAEAEVFANYRIRAPGSP